MFLVSGDTGICFPETLTPVLQTTFDKYLMRPEIRIFSDTTNGN